MLQAVEKKLSRIWGRWRICVWSGGQRIAIVLFRVIRNKLTDKVTFIQTYKGNERGRLANAWGKRLRTYRQE